MRSLVFVMLLVVANADDFWFVQTSGTDTSLRAVSVVAASDAGGTNVVVWASGSNGVILRSVDDGKNWERLKVPGGEKLDFRGVWAFDGKTAYVMSAGDGDQSRIYETVDGGNTWLKQFVGQRREVFLDGLVCWSVKECFVVGDPIDGKFLLLRTVDGARWEEFRGPQALKNEGVFAASNSSLVLCGRKDIYFGTGGSAARVFHSADSGQSWSARETPILSDNVSSGIFSLACQGDMLVAVGGNYQEPNDSERTAAYSTDGGKAWRLAEGKLSGFRSAVVRGEEGALIAVGTNGTDVSLDGGVHWARKSELNLNAAFAFDGNRVWAAGANGTIAVATIAAKPGTIGK